MRNAVLMKHGRMIREWTSKSLIAALALMLSGCWGGDQSAPKNPAAADGSPKPLRIVVTTGMVADLVRHVVGSHGEITSLMGSGVDPHSFRATRDVVKKLQEGDLVFYSGLTLEGRMQDALQQVNSPTRPVVPVTERLERVEKEFLRSPPEFEGHYDPHVWMDVSAWSRCLETVIETLSKVDPAHADEYQQNGKNYQSELAELDDYTRRVIESIPESHRVLVTAHDAFGYFGRRYGIEVRSVQGVTTESEAGIQDVNRLVDFLVERKLPAIFVESSVSEKNIRAVIEGTNSRQVTIRIGGNLFSDAMGTEGTYEGTYIGMIDHNATQISRALGGTAPERGWRGRLALSPVKPHSVSDRTLLEFSDWKLLWLSGLTAAYFLVLTAISATRMRTAKESCLLIIPRRRHFLFTT